MQSDIDSSRNLLWVVLGTNHQRRFARLVLLVGKVHCRHLVLGESAVFAVFYDAHHFSALTAPILRPVATSGPQTCVVVNFSGNFSAPGVRSGCSP